MMKGGSGNHENVMNKTSNRHHFAITEKDDILIVL